MKRLIIIQTVAPDYRTRFFIYLSTLLNDRFSLYCGRLDFQKSLQTDPSLTKVKPLINFYFFKRSFLIQLGGFWRDVFRHNVMVLPLNPRIINCWFILIIRWVLNYETVLWGHAWPRAGKNTRSDFFRNLMRQLGSSIIVYTYSQQRELQYKMPYSIIKAAPNSLYHQQEIKLPKQQQDITNLIYVGRLTPEKKPMLIVESFHQALSFLNKNVQLIIVGDGLEKIKIDQYIVRHHLEQRILTKGHISDREELQILYNSALFSVSPGYVGLSITQSFSFGVPILIAKDEPHSPEIEAAKENQNALFFESDNIANLVQKIIDIFRHKDYWISLREKITIECKANYTIESMSKVFTNLVKIRD